MIEKENIKEYNKLVASVLENPRKTRNNLAIFEKKTSLRLVFNKIVVGKGVVTEIGLYEPFKLFIEKKNLECLIREIKPSLTKKDSECACVLSGGRWSQWRGIILGILEKLDNLG